MPYHHVVVMVVVVVLKEVFCTLRTSIALPLALSIVRMLSVDTEACSLTSFFVCFAHTSML